MKFKMQMSCEEPILIFLPYGLTECQKCEGVHHTIDMEKSHDKSKADITLTLL